MTDRREVEQLIDKARAAGHSIAVGYDDEGRIDAVCWGFGINSQWCDVLTFVETFRPMFSR